MAEEVRAVRSQTTVESRPRGWTWRRLAVALLAVGYGVYVVIQVSAIAKDPWPNGLRLFAVAVISVVCISSARSLLRRS
jgi:hypothetical protein